MNVLGYEVTNEVIDACYGIINSGHSFTGYKLEVAARTAGAPSSDVAMRIADRLLQKERKAGNIEFKHARWNKVGK